MPEWWNGLELEMQRDAPLGPRTWYGVGGRAACLAQPASVEQLAALMQRCHEAGEPVRVLGGGANLLVVDDVPGVVVELSAPAFQQLRVDDTRLTVGGGYDLFKLVMETARHGLSGLEQVAGIPARLGGALRMNCGGSFGDISQRLSRVRVMDERGHVRDIPRAELRFGYRHTNIDEPLILEAEFDMIDLDAASVMQRVKEIFFYKRSSQPMAAHSAGCAFRNPPKDVADGDSAGALIDRAGLKGYRLGGAQVSDVHANFIVSDREGDPQDVLRLIEHVQQEVDRQFNIQLQREVVIWP